MTSEHEPALAPQGDLEWLMRTAGVDEQYLAQFAPEAWGQWSRAMRADPAGPNPVVPAWMRPLLPPWHHDFSAPFPCIGQLWPSAHDWFTEADRHAGELRLEVADTSSTAADTSPDLAQIRLAWDVARQARARPLLSMLLRPAEPWGHGVVGEIEAFYVIDTTETSVLQRDLESILRAASTCSAANSTPADLTPYLQHDGCGRGEQTYGWQWTYG